MSLEKEANRKKHLARVRKYNTPEKSKERAEKYRAKREAFREKKKGGLTQ